MTTFSIVDASTAGLRLVREKPRTLVVWAGVGLLVLAAVFVIFALMGGENLLRIANTVQSGAVSTPEALYELYKPLFPAYFAAMGVSLLAYCIVSPAVYRSVLQPQLTSPGYLKVGMDEVRQFAVTVSIWVMVAAIDFLISAVINVAGGGDFRSVGSIVAFLLMVFVSVKFSLAGPMTLATGRIALLGSWRLTRGRTGQALAAYLLTALFLFLIAMASIIVLMLISGVLGASTTLGAVGAALQVIIGVVFMVFLALVYGLVMAVQAAPSARIYQNLAAPEA